MTSLVRVAVLLSVFVFAAGTAFSAPLIVKQDDGTAEINFGFNADGDLWWANAFTATTPLQIVGLQVLFIDFDESNNPSGVATTDSLSLLLYNDPNNDGDPIDAVLLEQVATTVQSFGAYNGVSIPSTTVSGVFFVGALMAQDGASDPPPNMLPAARDDSGDPDYGWFSASLGKGTMDPADVAGTTDTGVLNLDDFGFIGIFNLRAVAVPEPGTLALLGLGGVLTALGVRRRRRARA